MNNFLKPTGIFLLGALFAWWLSSISFPPVMSAEESIENPAAEEGLPSLQSDVARLQDKAPDQAHAMMSVAYHFNNLWFAAEAKNWPLAKFYLDETRSHLRWAVRIIPVRKDSRGEEVKLEAILESLENSPLKQLEQAIQEEDPETFTAAYKFTIEGCYACHKASEKPYLRPQIPTRPAEPTINFDPRASWPR